MRRSVAAAVAENLVRRRHILRGHAVYEVSHAHADGNLVAVDQRGESQVYQLVKTAVAAQYFFEIHRAGVLGLPERIGGHDLLFKLPVVVLRPVLCVRHVREESSPGGHAVLDRRGIHAQRLYGGAGGARHSAPVRGRPVGGSAGAAEHRAGIVADLHCKLKMRHRRVVRYLLVQDGLHLDIHGGVHDKSAAVDEISLLLRRIPQVV